MHDVALAPTLTIAHSHHRCTTALHCALSRLPPPPPPLRRRNFDSASHCSAPDSADCSTRYSSAIPAYFCFCFFAFALLGPCLSPYLITAISAYDRMVMLAGMEMVVAPPVPPLCSWQAHPKVYSRQHLKSHHSDPPSGYIRRCLFPPLHILIPCRVRRPPQISQRASSQPSLGDTSTCTFQTRKSEGFLSQTARTYMTA